MLTVFLRLQRKLVKMKLLKFQNFFVFAKEKASWINAVFKILTLRERKKKYA